MRPPHMWWATGFHKYLNITYWFGHRSLVKKFLWLSQFILISGQTFNLWNLCLCFKCKYTKVFVCKESYIALLISKAVTGAEFLLCGFGLNKFQQWTFKYLFQVNLNKCKWRRWYMEINEIPVWPFLAGQLIPNKLILWIVRVSLG